MNMRTPKRKCNTLYNYAKNVPNERPVKAELHPAFTGLDTGRRGQRGRINRVRCTNPRSPIRRLYIVSTPDLHY